MVPALGVTEPGCIAFAVAKAKSYLTSKPERVVLSLNSGLYKNAYTCGIPNSSHYGIKYAAAFGLIMADSQKGLQALEGITPDDDRKAEQLIQKDRIIVKLSGISSALYCQATVYSKHEECTVTIEQSHTNITSIRLNGQSIFHNVIQNRQDTTPLIHQYSVKDIWEAVRSFSEEELSFIQKAFDMNMSLFKEGLQSQKTVILHQLYRMNENTIFSKDVQKSASLLCNGAIEARVLGLEAPAMSITGSGAHGIIATLPLYAYSVLNHCTNKQLYQATALSYLICMYIKEYSGKLSAFCGCGIAAGTGMACGLVYLQQGNKEQIDHVIRNMASSITGMICDGGNHGCVMKGMAAVDIAFESAQLAMADVSIESVHGINGMSIEDTLKNMGEIADPGMRETEKVIVDILKKK
ncbi:MAG: L-serine ammonia-lyase, iron-sulfur-dependent, subunit alpha [Faecalicoccus sp.]|uniref:L-cysteine desulfidase family protein n=1 Tax=unclassified Faecalicoccus TaxID=2643311 RepID=UPI0025F2E759|nr:L-serine ammonia-lyase, iron-sulfur-dependent, subunit alpha [Faecalicoccus sp.]MCI6378816.1 L-serine ammonia-lyase, iron-sulfur-dependent, subunit alpha [Erysipelotrichaceae bacterium]MDY4869735.1 L-serine ammonia-lyase, iron-sulfur-dependent, subunit alpha [Faecalicoccus sp.]